MNVFMAAEHSLCGEFYSTDDDEEEMDDNDEDEETEDDIQAQSTGDDEYALRACADKRHD